MDKYFNSPAYKHYLTYGIREDKEERNESSIFNIDIPIDAPIDEICYCHPKNTELDTLILCFSYLLTDCSKCFIDYEAGYETEFEFDSNTEGTYKEFKKLIKQNPEIVFIKNNFGLYPLELVELIDQAFIGCFNNYDNYMHLHGLAKLSFTYLHKIKNDLLKEYIKYELVKKVAYQYIKNSNHIGTDASLLQIPLHIWEYIFTFI